MIERLKTPAAILRQTPDLVWHIDALNEAMRSLLVPTADPHLLIGAPLADFVPPPHDKLWASALASDAPQSIEHPWPGVKARMKIDLLPMEDGEGGVRLRWVTAQPCEDKPLPDYQIRYEALFDSLPAMMHSINNEGVIIHVTERWLQVMGYSREEVIGQRSTYFLTPESQRLAFEKTLPHFMRYGRCDDVPYQMVTKSGELIDVLLSATSERDEAGRVSRSLAFMTDITALKRLAEERERNLQAEIERSALSNEVLNAQTELICRFLPDTTLLYVNEAYARTFHTTPTALVGRKFIDFIPEEDRSGIFEHLASVSDPAGTGWITYEHRAMKGGSVIWQEWTDSAIFDTEGRVLEYQSIGREITEQKQAELCLRDTNDKLARANADLEQFTRVAAHDLKAPLRGIRNLATWIEEDLEGQMSDEVQINFNHLNRRVTRLSNLLDDLLTYARLGQRASSVRNMEITALIQDVVEIVDPPQTFTVQIEGGPVSLTTYKTPLATVIRNLISNAIKHHDRAEGLIRLVADTEGERLRLDVIDDGPGIPQRFYERVFQPFTTLKSRDQVEGSGMGLAIVRRLVELNGGQITVCPAEPPSEGQAEPGRGTCFTFYWPLYTSDQFAGGDDED